MTMYAAPVPVRAAGTLPTRNSSRPRRKTCTIPSPRSGRSNCQAIQTRVIQAVGGQRIVVAGEVGGRRSATRRPCDGSCAQSGSFPGDPAWSDAQPGTPVAADDVIAAVPHARAVVRNPQGHAVGVPLRAGRLETVIAPQQRQGAAERLQVVAAAAAGAGVDRHVGMPAAELVPVGQVALRRAGSP